MSIEIVKANYLNQKHAEKIAFLMDSYATDPMGGGKLLTEVGVMHITDSGIDKY